MPTGRAARSSRSTRTTRSGRVPSALNRLSRGRSRPRGRGRGARCDSRARCRGRAGRGPAGSAGTTVAGSSTSSSACARLGDDGRLRRRAGPGASRRDDDANVLAVDDALAAVAVLHVLEHVERRSRPSRIRPQPSPETASRWCPASDDRAVGTHAAPFAPGEVHRGDLVGEGRSVLGLPGRRRARSSTKTSVASSVSIPASAFSRTYSRPASSSTSSALPRPSARRLRLSRSPSRWAVWVAASRRSRYSARARTPNRSGASQNVGSARAASAACFRGAERRHVGSHPLELGQDVTHRPVVALDPLCASVLVSTSSASSSASSGVSASGSTKATSIRLPAGALMKRN